MITPKRCLLTLLAAACYYAHSMSLKDDVIRYYHERAPVYDETAGFNDPVGEELRGPIKERYRELFRGRSVLEIACGTGYWTAVIGETAKSVLAIDINISLLEQAQARCGKVPHISFKIADAYTLEGVEGDFDAAAGFWWWSHVPKGLLKTFLGALHRRLKPGALVMFIDRLPYEGFYRKKDRDGNTIEQRILPDSRSFMIVKNFPDEQEIRSALAGIADDVRYVARADERNWEVVYRVRKS